MWKIPALLSICTVCIRHVCIHYMQLVAYSSCVAVSTHTHTHTHIRHIHIYEHVYAYQPYAKTLIQKYTLHTISTPTTAHTKKPKTPLLSSLLFPLALCLSRSQKPSPLPSPLQPKSPPDPRSLPPMSTHRSTLKLLPDLPPTILDHTTPQPLSHNLSHIDTLFRQTSPPLTSALLM